MPVAEVNGQHINYEDSGGDLPVVLFSHGFLMDHTMFDAQVEALSGTYRCIRWDERGFGSTPATEHFSYWDSAADAIALLDHLGVDKAALVGMSQGGFLSLRAALGYPDRVAGVVLIDSEPGVDPPETLEGYKGMVGHWLSDEPLGDVGEFVAGLIINDADLNAEWIAKWEARRSAGETGMEFASEALLSRDDITDRIGELQMPVLSIHGTDDASITIDKAEALQAAVPNGYGLIAIEGAAHAPNMTHAQPVNEAIAAFLGSI